MIFEKGNSVVSKKESERGEERRKLLNFFRSSMIMMSVEVRNFVRLDKDLSQNNKSASSSVSSKFESDYAHVCRFGN